MQSIKNLFWHLPKAIIANLIFLFPTKKLTLIGITGTDGKTTTAHLVYHILNKAGFKTGLITTTGAKIGNQEINTGLHTTSPDPFVLQSLFQKMVKSNITHVVCEVTSHALDQHRFWGCRFAVSALTNISHEHLDYHHSLENYITAKAKLFRQSRQAILNRDDPSYHKISRSFKTPTRSYSINKKSAFQAKNIRLLPKKLSFKIKQLNLTTDSAFHYQVYNILAALAISQQLNIPPSVVQQTIKKFPPIKGRRQAFKNSHQINCLIDFAHTPAALNQTLVSLKKVTKGQLIIIFGATGGRDPQKRPLMGQVVQKLSNIALITADDTRQENIKDINLQIRAGIDKNKSIFITNHNLTQKKVQDIKKHSKTKFTYFDIDNRQDAFNLALKLAKKGDTIIAAGKGHETTILHGKTEYPWSEQLAFETAFKNKYGSI